MGTYLSINDYSDSDDSDCVIFRLADSRNTKISLKEKLRKFTQDSKEIFGNHITCKQWAVDSKVLINDGGEDLSPTDFNFRFEYDASKDVITVHY